VRYIVEYILNNDFEWSVWYQLGRGTKTGPMSAEGFVQMDRERQLGKYVFFSVEVIA
jgi:hypothetical protein